MDEQENIQPEASELEPDLAAEPPDSNEGVDFFCGVVLGTIVSVLILGGAWLGTIRYRPQKHTGPVTVMAQGVGSNYTFKRPNGEVFIMDLEYKGTPVSFCLGGRIQDIVYRDGDNESAHEEFIKARFAQDSK